MIQIRNLVIHNSTNARIPIKLQSNIKQIKFIIIVISFKIFPLSNYDINHGIPQV
jgi:hypothetical protein